MGSVHETSNPPPPPTLPPPPVVDKLALRARALRVAAIAECDVRTALRALEMGLDAVHGLSLKERLRRAIEQTS